RTSSARPRAARSAGARAAASRSSSSRRSEPRSSESGIRRRATISYRSSSWPLRSEIKARTVRIVENGPARIEALTARLARLEQHTADETAAIRLELDDLRRGENAPAVPLPPVTAVDDPRAEPVDLSFLAGPRGLALAGGVVTLLGISF